MGEWVLKMGLAQLPRSPFASHQAWKAACRSVAWVLVYSDSGLTTAYDLSKQKQLTPLSQWGPGE